MPRIGEPRPAAEPSSGLQQERREAILRAAAVLAAVRPAEQVQMQEIARSAGVALGTLYRYFPSKMHLFVGVMADRVESMQNGIDRRPASSGTAADRVFDVLARATRTMLRQPHLSAAMLNSLNAADGTVIAEVGQIDQQVRRMLLDACGVNNPNPQQISLVRIVQQTWHGILQSSLNGRMSASEAEDSLRTACKLLLSSLSSTTADGEVAAELQGVRGEG
ncbi:MULTISPECIES: TetR family transcriptional regulator [unclassified Mycolicibacterium]|uniref:TetR family transcriptional regulator n=1 Tax=unclassified Mycolicibacterium TaxID=2636767 RepID=UPI00130816C2|nr:MULTISPECIES: TetR family transcriptional regulator [unclassified Mycolicibacterium]MUL81253.1 TetR/AcrR family transcriptional regulator [Mycolicibacterium sp. CBMA 329]MUL87019.1 TetR/AcrR family transcriptional regulator [Mycolicibacterium sp. CBMA 331]MUL98698.1 TetR/AcrR family transcriptional regulator [Mycolicibacterium sp. CBMA 334]MUM25561.1 TetR/AcrR family transcriptional regulator [Mycolicibacterium sp. CBMA 295]MUM37316.1 TetR/AcrR family transcriptional regulator [Mycolicibact